jgi:hypothetical protein
MGCARARARRSAVFLGPVLPAMPVRLARRGDRKTPAPHPATVEGRSAHPRPQVAHKEAKPAPATEIAHGAVWIQFQEKRRERKIYIGPNMMDFRQSLKRQRSQDVEPLTLKRVQGYERNFRLLAGQLHAFARRIQQLVGLPAPPDIRR